MAFGLVHQAVLRFVFLRPKGENLHGGLGVVHHPQQASAEHNTEGDVGGGHGLLSTIPHEGNDLKSNHFCRWCRPDVRRTRAENYASCST